MNVSPYTRISHVTPTDEPSLLTGGRLTIYIQPNQIYALVLSPTNELLLCWEFRNQQALNAEIFLRFVLEKETTLRNSFVERRVFVDAARFSLIPEPFYQEDQLIPLGRLLLDDALLEEELQVSGLSDPFGRVMFVVPPSLLHLLEHYFTDFRLHHICEASLTACAALPQLPPDFLLIHRLDGQVLLLAFRQQQLQLCNAYPIHSLPDLLYFVQLARKVARLTDADVPVYVWGEMMEKNSGLPELWEYLPDMEIPEGLMGRSGEKVAGTPYWKYMFLVQ